MTTSIVQCHQLYNKTNQSHTQVYDNTKNQNPSKLYDFLVFLTDRACLSCFSIRSSVSSTSPPPSASLFFFFRDDPLTGLKGISSSSSANRPDAWSLKLRAEKSSLLFLLGDRFPLGEFSRRGFW
mmetsp:Transcript_13448/g.22053  ORF Transcript_13448/g.22053 Transcript_13448/m.22053 type:complete len:125 (-) Transcript_13448:662-1036(-)